MMRKLMAIDPGLGGTGYAVWNTSAKHPQVCGVLHGGKGSWIVRVTEIAKQVRRIAYEHRTEEIICEMMESYNTAASSMSWATGDLQKTMFLIGTIHGMNAHRIRRFNLTPPREWKGQLPKSVTIMRVKEALGESRCRSLDIQTHAWDAVGIGLWYRGIIK
jgi:hypothetical protein